MPTLTLSIAKVYANNHKNAVTIFYSNKLFLNFNILRETKWARPTFSISSTVCVKSLYPFSMTAGRKAIYSRQVSEMYGTDPKSK